MSIVKQRNRYLIPFMYNLPEKKNFVSLIARSREWKYWKFASQDPNQKRRDYDTFQMIQDLFASSGAMRDENIGCEFIGNCENIEFPKFIYTKFFLEQKREIRAEISDCGLYLFRTGTGLMWYEVEFEDSITTEEMIEFQHDFRELAYESYKRKDQYSSRYLFEDAGDSEKPMLMYQWICRLLESLSVDIRYFLQHQTVDETANTIDIPDSALLYNYLVVDQEEAEQWESLPFYLTNGYTRRFRIPQHFADQMIRPFDNVRIHATVGGCGYYALADEENQYFFCEQMSRRIMQDYFLLYVLSLYQFYTLLRYSEKIYHEIYADYEKYLEGQEDLLEQIRVFETDINVFLVKSVYSSVSYIGHQNDYYNYLMRQFRIKENVQSLTVGLDSLQTLQTIRSEKKKEELEQKEEERQTRSETLLNLGLGVLSVLAIPSAYVDAKALVDLLGSSFGWSEEMQKRGFLCITLVLTLSILAAIFMISRAFRGGKKGDE